MHLELLETFLDLSETKNFNRTAERLRLTQSTVSSRIRTLEGMLDKQLFIRGKSGTELTASGIRFQQHARALKLHWVDARREIQTIGIFDQFMRGGLASQMYERLLVGWLEWIRQMLPNLAVYVEIDYSDQMIHDVMQGSLDLAVLYSPRHLPDMHYEEIAEERYLMVSTRDVALKEIDKADYIKAFHSIPFSLAHKQLLPELEDVSVTVGNIGAIEFLLRQRGGTAYVTHPVAKKLEDEAVARVVSDAPAISHPIYSAMHVRHRHSHIHHRLLTGMKRIMNGSLRTGPEA